MTNSQTDTHDPIPVPHRAPGFDALSERRANPFLDPSPADRIGRRQQRAFDGWLAGRIRKRARHWRAT